MCEIEKKYYICRDYVYFAMKRSLMILAAMALMLPFGMTSASAQKTDSLKLTIYFRQNMSNLDLDYRDNEAHFDRFVSEVKKILADPTCRVIDITIRSGASPEGKFDNNKALSRRRGECIKGFLDRSLSIPGIPIRVDAVGEDWAAFREMVENNIYPDKKEILDILYRHTDYINGRPRSVIGGPKKELMDLNGGKTWFWLLRNVFPDLRSANNSIICRYTRDAEPAPKPKSEHPSDTMVIIHKYIFEIDTLSNGKFPVDLNDSTFYKIIGAGASIDSVYRDTVNPRKVLDATFAPNLELNVPDGQEIDILLDSKVVVPQGENVQIKAREVKKQEIINK